MDKIPSFVGSFLGVLLFVLLIAALIRSLYALWGREDLKQTTKICWMIFFVLAPVIGILCYILFGHQSDYIEEFEEIEE